MGLNYLFISNMQTFAPASVPPTPNPSLQAKPQEGGGTRCYRDAFGSARTPSLCSSASRPIACISQWLLTTLYKPVV